MPTHHGRGGDLSAAMQALITTMNSSALREQIYEASEFPLQDDLPAFLLVNQLIYRTTARPTDLADAIGTGRSNVSKIVRRLELAGLVGRMPDPEDGRHTVIGLTAEGRVAADRIARVVGTSYDLIFENWSAEDFDQLERLVVRLVNDIDLQMEQSVERIAGVTLPRPAPTVS